MAQQPHLALLAQLPPAYACHWWTGACAMPTVPVVPVAPHAPGHTCNMCQIWSVIAMSIVGCYSDAHNLRDWLINHTWLIWHNSHERTRAMVDGDVSYANCASCASCASCAISCAQYVPVGRVVGPPPEYLYITLRPCDCFVSSYMLFSRTCHHTRT